MMADQRGRDKKEDERELLFQTRNKQKQQQPSLLDRTLCLYLGRERKREESNVSAMCTFIELCIIDGDCIERKSTINIQ